MYSATQASGSHAPCHPRLSCVRLGICFGSLIPFPPLSSYFPQTRFGTRWRLTASPPFPQEMSALPDPSPPALRALTTIARASGGGHLVVSLDGVLELSPSSTPSKHTLVYVEALVMESCPGGNPAVPSFSLLHLCQQSEKVRGLESLCGVTDVDLPFPFRIIFSTVPKPKSSFFVT